MSFLMEVKNFIKTEILGIDDIDTRNTSAQKKENKAILECKTEAPEDKFEKRSETVSEGKKINYLSSRAMEESITNIPAATVNLKKMVKEALVEKISGCNKDAFEKLPPNKQKMVFEAIQASVKKYENLKNEENINKDANIEALIISSAKNIYEALSTGVFDNIEEYTKASGNINKTLGKDFDNYSKTVRRAKFKETKNESYNKLQIKIKEIKKLPKDQQKVQLQKLMQQHRYVMRSRALDVAAQRKSETAVDATLLLSAEDMEYGAKMVLQTRSTDAERTKAADYADYEFAKEIIQINAGFGDIVQPEVLKKYTQTYMEYKSANAAYAYQTDYKADRISYEAALKKQQNGEVLTPEEETILNYMSAEYYTATAQGIGQGILSNINMTADEKAQFLVLWVNDAEQFNDYEQVISDVRKTINELDEYKEVSEKFKEYHSIEQTSSSEESATVENDTSSVYNQKFQYNSSIIYTAAPFYENIEKPSSKDSAMSVKAKSELTEMQTELKTNSNKLVIFHDIKQDGIEKAVAKYGSSAIQIILDAPCFKYLRPKLTTLIRSYNINELKKISEKCTDSAFIYICSVVNEDFVRSLRENREKTKGLCYNASNQIKKMEGEYEAA